MSMPQLELAVPVSRSVATTVSQMTMSPMTMSSTTMVVMAGAMAVMAGAMAVTVNYQLMQMVMQNTTVTNTAPKPGKRHEKEQTRQGAEWGRTPA